MSETETDCRCYACVGDKPAYEGSWLTVGMTRMILCATCGNKRCPHATDHRNSCTGSNEPNQPGSRYQYVPHDHREFVEGCFRCDLSRAEARPAAHTLHETEESK